MSSLDEQMANQIANIERGTGRSLADWIAIVRDSGIEKHGEAVAMLKDRYGMGHGNANLIVIKAREHAAGGPSSPDAVIATHYAGKNSTLRPLYDAVIKAVSDFGPDVELAPKKTYVSIRRRKQFASVGPAAGQLEVCLNLPGNRPTERLTPISGMATHRVRIGDISGFDGELLGWLREAYDRA